MSDPPSASVSPLPLVIAVDGPAAAGKGTLARRLADALNLAHLDSGALYRAVGLAVLRAGGDPADEAAAVAAAASLDTGRLSDPALRAPETGDAASRVASSGFARPCWISSAASPAIRRKAGAAR